MQRIFLSYRRSDSDYALLLFEFLKQHFGRDCLFLDTQRIELGENFVATLERELQTCAALVALVGRGWIDSIPRLSESGDFVRLELSSTLARDILLIPVLAGGAKMPRPEELPAAVSELSQLSALEVRVHNDLESLVKTIGKVVSVQTPPNGELEPRQKRVLDLLRRQVHRLQARAVELLDSGEPDRALDELREGTELLLCLQEWSPAEVTLTLLLGYIYKTLGQAYTQKSREGEATRYFDLAESVFKLAETPAAQRQYSQSELASAINGLGNIRQLRGDVEDAIKSYRRAVAIEPDYAYAWHDLFGALDAQARSGQLDLAEMREALTETRRTGVNIPGLGKTYLDKLSRRLAYWEQQAGDA